MIESYICLVSIVLFIISMIVGRYIYSFEKKEKYNYLTMFPYEIKPKAYGLLITFRGLLALWLGVCSISSIYIFFINQYLLIEKVLTLVIVINAFLILSLFVVDMKNYKLHQGLAVFSSLFNIFIYLLLGYLGIRFAFTKYPLALTIISFVIALVLIVILLLPSLKNWYILKRDEEGNLTRGKIFPLAFFEWINIISFVLFYLIIGITFLII